MRGNLPQIWPIWGTLLLATVAHADDPVAAAADGVLAAWKAGDTARVATLARDREIDPWLIADDLARRKEFDAAAAYAGKLDGLDFERLPAYIAWSRTHPREKTGHGRRAMAAHAAGRIDEALAHLDKIDVSAPSAFAIRVIQLKAMWLRERKRLAPSRKAFEEAARRAERIGWLSSATDLYLQAAGSALLYDPKGALRMTQRSLRLAERRGARVEKVRALQVLGTLALMRSDAASALLYTERARDLARDPAKIAEIDTLLLRVRSWMGEGPRALAAIDRALKAAKGTDRMHEMELLDMKADVLDELKRSDEAIPCRRAALTMAREREDAARAAAFTGSLGRTLRLAGRPAEAIPELEAARAHFAAADEPGRMLALDTDLAYAHFEAGDTAAARRHADSAVETGHSGFADRAYGQKLGSLSMLYVKLGDAARAQRLIEYGLALADDYDPESRASLLLTLARVCDDAGDVAGSLAAMRRVIAELARTHRGLGDREAVATRRRWKAAAAAGLAVAAESKRPDDILYFLEARRARALLESVADLAELRRHAVPDDLVPEAVDLRRRAFEARATLDRARTALKKASREKRDARREDVAKARRALAALEERMLRLQKQSTRVADTTPVALAELQAALGEREAAVIYGNADALALALVVTRTGTRLVGLGEHAPIDATASALIGVRPSRAARGLEIKGDVRVTGPRTDPSDTIARLRKLVAVPLALPETTRRVVVVPIGRLAYLPAALVFPGRDVVLAPSATAYVRAHAADNLRGEEVLAIGDPAYRDRRIRRLPASRREARAIGDVTLLGEDTTVSDVKLAVGARKHWRAIHFACHGVTVPDRPRDNALLLADGRLPMRDIMGLQASADLVVLSACETGRGEIYNDEGVIGLPRAFLFAGARGVIVSLWKVDDEATSALMADFYRRWKEGAAPAAALRAAQAHVAAQEKWRHPYFWAAWQLWGQG